MRKHLLTLLVAVGVTGAIGIAFGSRAEAQRGPSDTARWLPRDDECQGLQPYWTPCKGRVPDRSIKFNTIPGYVLMGRPNVWEGAPDFFLNAENRYWGAGPYGSEGTPKLYVRSVVLADKGDTPDLAMRRAGPDQGGPFGTPEVLGDAQGIGTIYWQAWGGNCSGGASWYAGCGGFGRVAEIYALTVGAQTATSRAGKVCFNTTPTGNPGNGLQRFCINETGQLVANSGGTPEQPAVALRESATGLFMSQSSAGLGIAGQAALTVSVPVEPRRTSMTLLVNRGDGTTTQQPVEVGDANSCGTGYRCLRIPN